MRTTSTQPGLLLSQAAPSKVESWLRRGTLPAYVVPLGRWTGVVSAGPSLALPPYDDAASILAARPVPGPLRTTVGFFVVGRDEMAVVVVRSKSPRGASRWLAWRPEHGAMTVPDHDPLNVRDLLSAAGLADSERTAVLRVLARREGECRGLLIDLVEALGLPGADLLSGGRIAVRDDVVLATPDPKRVARFDRDVNETSPDTETDDRSDS